MTNDEHEALIKKTAEAIRLAYAKEMYTGMGFESAAEAAFAVFEQAHSKDLRVTASTPTDDEREALANLIDDELQSQRIFDLRDMASAILAAGFRRPVHAEPTDAQLADIESRVYDAHRGHVAGMAKEMVRAGWRAALKEGENRG